MVQLIVFALKQKKIFKNFQKHLFTNHDHIVDIIDQIELDNSLKHKNSYDKSDSRNFAVMTLPVDF